MHIFQRTSHSHFNLTNIHILSFFSPKRKLSLTNTMTFMIPEFIQYLLQIILYRITTLICFPTCKFSIYPDDSKIQVGKKQQDSKLSKRLPSFRGDEVELVMGNLGILCHPKVTENFSCNDLFNMFEEEQPRLDEVKGAFDVFDENKDGFIDARELQRVLYSLGLKDRAATNDCKNMIRLFDDNADGRIDFDEFVKLMENTFC